MGDKQKKLNEVVTSTSRVISKIFNENDLTVSEGFAVISTIFLLITDRFLELTDKSILNIFQELHKSYLKNKKEGKC